MRLPAVLFLLLGASALAAQDAPVSAAERGLPLIRNFPPRTYRAHEQVWSIVIAPNGELLAGNNDRVLVFDGFEWRHVPVPGASFVRELRAGADGTVWVGGVNELGRLRRGADGEWRYESLRALVPEGLGNLGPLWKIHVREDGVWFQGNSAALRWDGVRFDVWPMQERTVALSYEWRGRLLVCRVDGWFTPATVVGEWERVGPKELGAILPRGLFRHTDGTWLVITPTDGLQAFDGEKLTPFAAPINEWLRGCRPYGVVTLADGRRVFTSITGGVVVCSPDLSDAQRIDEPAGLLSNTVITAAEDAFGALWIGTERGLARLDLASPFTAFAQEAGLGRDGAETVARVDGVITCGATQGTLVLEPAQGYLQRARFARHTEVPDKFYSFLKLEGGTLAGSVTGLHWIVGDKVERLKSPSNVREVIALRSRPGVFIGTHLRGLASWRREGETWHYDGAWAEPRDELRGLIEDETGALWTTTSAEGVLRVRLGEGINAPLQVERFGDAQGLPTLRSRVWLVGTSRGPLVATRVGLFRHDAATNRFVPEEHYGTKGIFDGKAAARLFAEDDRGGLWILFDPSEQSATRLYYARDGVAEAVPLPNAEALGKGRGLFWERTAAGETLWLSLESSLLRCDVAVWRARRGIAARGATQLAAVELPSGVRVPAGAGPVVLKAAENTVRFRFGTPWLAGEPDAWHETRLTGFREGGVELGRATERTFTNLPPGRYTFEVRGRSADGRWSDPARAALIVLAPWWQTPAAVALWVVLFGLALFAYIRWRIRGLTRARERLEKVVAERTAELADKNRELERLHRVDQDEKLAARLAEEKAQLELLRYQLNPHFLYNSLNSIRALVFTNAEAAGEMVTRLSEFCWWTLTRRGDGLTTVGDEVEMLQAYLDIERTRWQDGLRARIEVDEAARHDPLPQFLFLPLLENAIKYGGKTSPGVLEVTCHVRIDDGHLVCEVSNTGRWVAPDSRSSAGNGESTGIGLDNLRQRLARHYGPDCRPEILTMPGWVCVRLRLPRHPKSPGSNSPV
jgi:signal transduction histidine kinase